MDNCNKWQKQKLQKLAKCMYRICFNFTRRYFGVSLFLTHTHKKKFTARNSDKKSEEESNRWIIRWLPWKQGISVLTVFLTKHKDLGTRNYV